MNKFTKEVSWQSTGAKEYKMTHKKLHWSNVQVQFNRFKCNESNSKNKVK